MHAHLFHADVVGPGSSREQQAMASELLCGAQHEEAWVGDNNG